MTRLELAVERERGFRHARGISGRGHRGQYIAHVQECANRKTPSWGIWQNSRGRKMPARPLPLRPKEPPKRPKGIPDGLWNFPRNLAAFANSRKLSQADVAAMAGVSPSSISRWLSYDIEGLPVWGVLALEEGMGLPHGSLTLPPEAFADAMRRSGSK